MDYSLKKKNKFNFKYFITILISIILTLGIGFGITFGFVKNYVDKYSNITNIQNNTTNEEVNNNYKYDFEINYGEASPSLPTINSLADVVERVMPTTISVFCKTPKGTNSGSGVIVEKSQVKYENNLIAYEFIAITNYHVIANIKESNISVEFFIKNLSKTIESNVTLVGADYKNDIAVLKIYVSTVSLSQNDINALNISPAPWIVNKKPEVEIKSLADLSLVEVSEEKVRLGEEIFIIGNQLGIFGGSITTGVVSAKGRKLTIEGVDCVLNQTNTVINGGNSGGGVFNYKGELIGIVKAKANGEEIENIGFYIPVNDVYKTYVELRQTEADTSNSSGYGYIKGRKTIGVVFDEGVITENQNSLESDYSEQIMQTKIIYTRLIDLNNIKYIGSNKFSTANNQQSVISEIKVYKFNNELTTPDKFELVETITLKNLTLEKIDEIINNYDIGTKLVFKTRKCSTVSTPFEVSVLINQLIYQPN